MNKVNQKGFALPIIIILISLMSITSYSILSIAGSSVGQSYDTSRQYTVQSALKAGINLAETQLDDSYCGSYNGSPETNLVVNDNYRLTYQIDVLSKNSSSSMEISNTVKMYMPASAKSPKITKTMQAKINSALPDACKNPGYYGPIVWLDAQNNRSAVKLSSELKTVIAQTNYGAAADTSRDTIEELQSNGDQTTESWKSKTVRLHNCSTTSFGRGICGKKSSRTANAGLIFKGINIPKNSYIASSTLTLQCSNQLSSRGPVTHQVKGFYQSSNDANPELFSQNTNSQIKTKINDNLLTAAAVSNTENACNSDGKIYIDITSIVQEIINNGGWNPNDNNQSTLGLIITKQAGDGSREIQKTGNTLSISYSSANQQLANNGERLDAWLDQSSQANNAIQDFDTAPTVDSSGINGLPAILFNNSSVRIELSKPLNNNKEMTVFAVIKPSFSSSAKNGRLISGMLKTADNDSALGKSIIPLLRNGEDSGFGSQYANTPNGMTASNCEECDGKPMLLSSIFKKATDNNIDALIHLNGQDFASRNAVKPAATNYSYNIDQIYIGSSRDGAMPGSAINFFNGQYGEIIVYDKALTCQQINSISNYLRTKWKLSGNEYLSSCQPNLLTVN